MTRQLDIRINTPNCTGCHVCEIVCSLYHEDAISVDKARIRISDKRDESLFEPHICQLCESPDCVTTCPTSALAQDSQGIIQLDGDLCNGCEACVTGCPYEAIRWDKGSELLFICDRCDGDPMCVKSCNVKALELPGGID